MKGGEDYSFNPDSSEEPDSVGWKGRGWGVGGLGVGELECNI